jgi:hypothetical protein
MTDLPTPQAHTDDFDEAADRAAYEAQVNLAWHDALEWVRGGGEYAPLVTLLRGDFPLQDIRELRDFLADVLEKKVKRGRGRPKEQFSRSWAIGDDGVPMMVNVRENTTSEIQRYLRSTKPVLGKKAAVAAAADKFKRIPETIENALNRESSTRPAIRNKRPSK